MKNTEFFEGLTDKGQIKSEPSKGFYWCYFPKGSEETIHFEWFYEEKIKSLKICIHFFEINKNRTFKNIHDMVWNFRDIIEKQTGEEVKLGNRPKWNYSIYIEKQNSELNEETKKWAKEKMEGFYNAIKDELGKISEELGKI